MKHFRQILILATISTVACTNTQADSEDLGFEDSGINRPLQPLDQMIKDTTHQSGTPAGQMMAGMPAGQMMAGAPAGQMMAGAPAGSNPVDPVDPPGACSDMTNLGHIAVPNMETLFNECVASCIFQGDACSVMCLEMKLSLSPDCATCFAALGKCGASNCALDCASDSHSPACSTCTETNCAAAFLSCAGLNLDFKVPQNMNNMNNGGNSPVCIADGMCNDACVAPTTDPDCNNGGNGGNGGNPPVCIADGMCNGACVAPTIDPDCNNGGNGGNGGGNGIDPCAIDGLYGDGECDVCPVPDPDCGGGDPCLIEDLYGDGLCDFCPMPDPDCF
jgi:hypothetical protein